MLNVINKFPAMVLVLLIFLNVYTVFSQDPTDYSDCHVYGISAYQADYIKGLPESKWHNPYMVKPNEKAVELFEKYILTRQDLLNNLQELDGKILVCWCKPLPCHGDVLIKLIENGKEKVKETKDS